MITEEQIITMKHLSNKAQKDFDNFSQIFYEKFVLAMDAYFINKFGFAFKTMAHQKGSFSEYKNFTTANATITRGKTPYNFFRKVAFVAGLTMDEMEKWVVEFGKHSTMPKRVSFELSPADKLKLRELEMLNHELNEDLTDYAQKQTVLSLENEKLKSEIVFLRSQLTISTEIIKNLSKAK